MNELATSNALDLAMWAVGGLFAVLAALIGIIYTHNRRQHEDLACRVKWIEGHHVTKETLDRVERTWTDAIDAMTEQRREMHEENKAGIREIKESITGIHRRIDLEFRQYRRGQADENHG